MELSFKVVLVYFSCYFEYLKEVDKEMLRKFLFFLMVGGIVFWFEGNNVFFLF